jgi:hypothetical protein
VPIPGTTKLHRLEENLGAENVELSREDLGALETAASKIPGQGARHPESLQKLVGREPWQTSSSWARLGRLPISQSFVGS